MESSNPFMGFALLALVLGYFVSIGYPETNCSGWHRWRCGMPGAIRRRSWYPRDWIQALAGPGGDPHE